MALFVSAYSRVRIASKRGKPDNPAERPATNVSEESEIIPPNAPRPTFRTTFAQEYYINYNYKSNSQEYIQSIIKYTINIVINVLELAFQSHEGVGTEDFYLSQTLGHGRCL